MYLTLGISMDGDQDWMLQIGSIINTLLLLELKPPRARQLYDSLRQDNAKSGYSCTTVTGMPGTP